MPENTIARELKEINQNFLMFMNIEEFPDYDYELINLESQNSMETGYGALVSIAYAPENYTLKFFHKLIEEKAVAAGLFFHEFTHMLDIQQYCKVKKDAHVYLRGYMEYHATQVELVKGLGAATFDSVDNFSVKQIIDSYPYCMPVEMFLGSKYDLALLKINQPDFPRNINELVHVPGIVFNYLGCLSICRLYATDFKTLNERLFDTTSFRSVLGEEYIEMESRFTGILSSNDALESFELFKALINKLYKRLPI